MADKTYNGWTNFETWAVRLWLAPAYGVKLQQELLEQARNTPTPTSSKGQELLTRAQTTLFTFKDLLREQVEDNSPLADTASMYSDLMRSAINRVNFTEIASYIIEAAGEK